MKTHKEIDLRIAIENHYLQKAWMREWRIVLPFLILLAVAITTNVTSILLNQGFGISFWMLCITALVAAYVYLRVLKDCTDCARKETEALLSALQNPLARISAVEVEDSGFSAILSIPAGPVVLCGGTLPANREFPLACGLLEILQASGVTVPLLEPKS